MKQSLLVFIAVLTFSLPAFSAAAVDSKTSYSVEVTKNDAKKDWESLSKKERRAQKKSIRKQLKKAFKNLRKEVGSNSDLLLLIIIAILIPPLAMALYDGLTNRFWLSLLLTLLFYIPGLIYTLVVILGD
jgi:uncharacterized membrane protein YqaE (UPF0057 family)